MPNWDSAARWRDASCAETSRAPASSPDLSASEGRASGSPNAQTTRANGSGRRLRSQLLSRSAGRAARATGWIGVAKCRARAAIPGLATPAGPRGPSTRTATVVPASSWRSRPSQRRRAASGARAPGRIRVAEGAQGRGDEAPVAAAADGDAVAQVPEEPGRDDERLMQERGQMGAGRDRRARCQPGIVAENLDPPGRPEQPHQRAREPAEDGQSGAREGARAAVVRVVRIRARLVFETLAHAAPRPARHDVAGDVAGDASGMGLW